KRRAYLACKRSALFPIHILRADLDILRSAQPFTHLCNRGERRNDDHFDIGNLAHVPKERFHEPRGLALRHVHLPIGGDDFLSHFDSAVIPSGRSASRAPGGRNTYDSSPGFFGFARKDACYLCVSAAAPGNSLPSSNSSVAPPPVELNVI